ncbi:hypothetical protein EMPS_09437 [Entomortierella parvispora]|uniref:Cas12f1-like TNB domain-containing protein n=1 Tax=Entomortierella parvispora TaxID=205924 RepID=A0A9P3M0A9_9FUNG|nr:hypothetical protein EMPS_09437 [Entomortierella parvispora]
MSPFHPSTASTSSNNPPINNAALQLSPLPSTSPSFGPVSSLQDSASTSDTLPDFSDLHNARMEAWPLLTRSMDRMFNTHYNKSADFIHYDGGPTVQKAFAHDRRLKANEKASIKMSELLASTDVRLSVMESKSTLSNKQLSRLKRHLNCVVFPHWMKCRGVDPRATVFVSRELHTSHGWKSHICHGQFDICAGKLAKKDPNITVVTTDSDLLFSGVKECVRIQLRGTSFYSYPIEGILAHCKLHSHEQWVAAAVVSLNDYDPSVGRTSFKTAVKEMEKLHKTFPRNCRTNLKAKDYVKEFCKGKHVDINSVERSLESFVDLLETPVEQLNPQNDVLDDSIRRIVYRVEMLTQRCRSSRRRPTSSEPISSLATLEVDDLRPVSLSKRGKRERRPGFRGYISGHVFRQKAFAPVFTHPDKNTDPIGCKNMTIGRPVPGAPVLVADEEDDFPDDDDPKSPMPAPVPAPAPSPASASKPTLKPAPEKTTALTTGKASKKRARAAIVFAPAKRRNRDAEMKQREDTKAKANVQQGEEVQAEDEKKRRMTNPTNMIGDVVASRCQMAAMRPGRLESCLRYSLKNSFPMLSKEQHELLLRHITGIIRTLARVHSDLLREGLLVTELYIASVFKEFPVVDGDLGQDHAGERSGLFNNILLKKHRDPFFQRLLKRLLKWDWDSNSTNATSQGSMAADKIFDDYFKLTQSQRKEAPFKKEDQDICDKTFVEQCARTLSDMVGEHVFKYTLELKSRVILHNPSWSSSARGKKFLDSVNEKGVSLMHDRLSLHAIMNWLIPAGAQIKILPQVGFTDGFFALTERQLVSCILKGIRVANPMYRTLNKVFGNKGGAEKNTQDEVGRLSFFLFLNGRNTCYRQGTNVLWAKDYSGTSSSNPLPTLQQLPLRDMMFFESDAIAEFEQASEGLGTNANAPGYEDLKKILKDVIGKGIHSPEHYQHLIDIAAPKVKRPKYVLTGDISTNGYDLRVMAYKLTEKKRRALPAASSTPNVADPATSSLLAIEVGANASSELFTDPDLISRTPALDLPPSVEGQSSSEMLPSVSMPDVASTAAPAWSTAPSIEGWPYVAEAFNSQEKINKLYRDNAGPQTGIRVLCLDPGVACTATGTLVHSNYPEVAINLTIPRGSRDIIDNRYRKEQSARKIKEGIPDIEARLVALKPVEARLVLVKPTDVKTTDPNNLDQGMKDVPVAASVKKDTDSLNTAMKAAVHEYEETVKAHIISQAKESSALRNFYGTKKFKRDKYDYREAIRHDLDKSSTAILNMRHCVPHPQATDADLLSIISAVQEDFEGARHTVSKLPRGKQFDWNSYSRVMDNADRLQGDERSTFLASANATKDLVKTAQSLYKVGYMSKNQLSDEARREFLESPLIIGVGDGDYRKWRGQSRGCGQLIKNLIRQKRDLVKDLARGNTKSPVIELVKIPEFRTSVFCCSCLFRGKEEGRSIVCKECDKSRDRDHNSATNMSNAVLNLLRGEEWPAPLDFAKAKFVDKFSTTTLEV